MGFAVKKIKKETPFVPDDLDELAHVDVIRDQKLRLVQNGKLLLALVPLNDDLKEVHTLDYSPNLPRKINKINRSAKSYSVKSLLTIEKQH